MRDFGRKFVSLLIVFLFGVVIYNELIASPTDSNGLIRSSSFTVSDSQKMYEALGGNAGGLPVTLFVTEWCSICKSLESAFSQGGLPYVRADIESNRDALLYYEMVTRRKTTGVPVTVIGERVIVGYNMRAIAEALKATVEARGDSQGGAIDSGVVSS
jgi:glutaredoxin